MEKATISIAAALLGAKGGRVKSDAKTKAARKNGKKKKRNFASVKPEQI